MQFGFSQPVVPTITHEDRDCDNKLGTDLLGMVGCRYRRASDQVTVKVVAIDWMPETSLWGIRVAELMGTFKSDTCFTYSHAYFFGYRRETRNFCAE